MKKNGFTLAEVLITLTIIGIVAAMTMPSLLSSIEKGQIGPKLAKAINTLENANRNALQQYDEHSLVTIAKKINKDDPQYTYILDTQVAGSVDAANSKIFRSADGINYIMEGSGATSRPSNCTVKDKEGKEAAQAAGRRRQRRQTDRFGHRAVVCSRGSYRKEDRVRCKPCSRKALR